MSRKPLEKFHLVLVALLLSAYAGIAQAPPQRPLAKPVPAPVTNITMDGNEAMFTTMCALYASGFDSEVSADHWSAFRAQMRETLRKQQGPAVEAVREFYRQHQSRDTVEMLSRYVWFGIVAGPAPKFQPVLRRDELPPEVLTLEGFSEILSSYYTEQKIGQLWRQVQPVYNKETGQFSPRFMLPLSLSYDHRVIDGADGIRFLRWVAEALEQPFLMALNG